MAAEAAAVAAATTGPVVAETASVEAPGAAGTAAPEATMMDVAVTVPAGEAMLEEGPLTAAPAPQAAAIEGAPADPAAMQPAAMTVALPVGPVPMEEERAGRTVGEGVVPDAPTVREEALAKPAATEGGAADPRRS